MLAAVRAMKMNINQNYNTMLNFNEIRKTDKFQRFATIMDRVNYLEEKHGYSSVTNDIKQELIELMGDKYLDVYEFRQKFSKIQDYCEKFFECPEKGFSYELGCKYQHIKFDYPANVKAEIDWLNDLLKIYNSDYKEEIKLIEELINDLKIFKKYFKAIASRAEV
jgi:hypothetical protein